MKLSKQKIFLFQFSLLIIFLVSIEAIAQLIWYYKKYTTFQAAYKKGEVWATRAGVNFIRIPDKILGYRLKPDQNLGSIVINKQGFSQPEEVDICRPKNSLRIMAVGESTTQGHSIQASYPLILQKIIRENSTLEKKIEVINAGVSGYISDQWRLLTETKLAQYKPDIVLFYVGWNDFQGYSPVSAPSHVSWYDQEYGDVSRYLHSTFLKAPILANDFLKKFSNHFKFKKTLYFDDEGRFKFLGKWESLNGAKIQFNYKDIDAYSQFILPPNSHVYQIINDALLNLKKTELYTISFACKGTGKLTIIPSGASKPWNTYNRCETNLTHEWSLATCTFQKTNDHQGLAISLANNDDDVATKIEIQKIVLNKGAEALAYKNKELAPIEETYKFFIKNLDLTVAAFKKENPSVKIIISTLVGRWPLESNDEFHKNGQIHWMVHNGVTNIDAKHYLNRFNNMIREYAKKNDLYFVDAASYFENIDRNKIMFDFCHMHEEGYAMIADLFYKQLIAQKMLEK